MQFVKCTFIIGSLLLAAACGSTPDAKKPNQIGTQGPSVSGYPGEFARFPDTNRDPRDNPQPPDRTLEDRDWQYNQQQNSTIDRTDNTRECPSCR